MRLPESFQSLLPAGVELASISDGIVLRGESTETLLVRLPTGPRVLSRSKPEAKFEVSGEIRELRIEGGALKLRGTSGDVSIPLTSWLDRELVRDFLAVADVPAGRATPPPPRAVPPLAATSSASAPAPASVVAQAGTVSPAAPPTPAAAASGGPMRLTLKLLGQPCQNTIMAIKVVREMTGVGLKEAKDLVEQGGEATVVGGPNLARQIDELRRAGCSHEFSPG